MVNGVSGSGKTGSLINQIGKNEKNQRTTFARIASGSRINKAADDPAGLAIAESLLAQSSVIQQGVRNSQDAISVLNITDGALGQVNDISTRLSELAIQSANGTLSDTQRQSLSEEFNALTQEIGRIAETTQFNGQQLLTGENVTAQVGLDGGGNSQISTESVNVSQLVSSLQSLDISTQQGARDALQPIADFRTEVNQGRGRIGASQSRLETTIENALTADVGFRESEAAIRDANIASESANLVSQNIRANAGVALLAQAGRQNAGVVQRLLS